MSLTYLLIHMGAMDRLHMAPIRTFYKYILGDIVTTRVALAR